MRTHERVLAQIEDNIRTGVWALGMRLPGERVLAEQMGVSRPSVREAVRVLEAMGIVRTAVGSGPESGAIIIDRPAAGLGAAVRLHIASGTLPVRDVVAARAALETWATGQAALRLTPEADLADAEAALARMVADAPLTPRGFVQLDQQFHHALVRLAENQLVEAILLGLRTAVDDYIIAGAELVADWAPFSDRLCAEHRSIFDAVVAGDAASAERQAHDHVWGFYRDTGLASGARR
jgi:DNA-binding FadR family transcriptional regulator